MSIINTLREKMGRLVVIVVGLSIMAFVLTDLLGPGSSIMGGGNNPDIGEISGESITYQSYLNMVESMKQNFINQYGSSPNEFLMQTFRNQAWEQLINEIAYGDRFEAANMVVGASEQIDMVQGDNISPQISQNPAFQNPQTGTFDPAYMPTVLANFNGSEYGRFQWIQFQQQLNASRKQQKFENLFTKTNYVTLAEAKREYLNQMTSVNIDYVYVPYGAVSDSVATVTDNDLRNYLNAHKEEYQVEESRSIDYISFPIVPSAEDSATYKAEMDDVKRRLEESQSINQDSLIAIDATEQGVGFGTFDPNILPSSISDNMSELKVGDVLGPNLTNGIYTVHKLSGVVEGENEYVKVSHILLKTTGMNLATKNQVRSKAQGLLSQLRNGADFAELARKNSEDGSGPSGGQMDWYRKGGEGTNVWVKPFEDAAFAARRTGLINRLIETEFGYHIMYVNNVASKNRYKVATVIVEMTPSFETQNEVYMQVNEFMANANDFDSFNEYANDKGYAIFSGNNIGSNASSIGRLTDARQVVTWLYRDASIQDVKEFEMGDEYIVALYRYKVDAGTAQLNNVRNQIEPLVRNEKKLAYIKSKLEGLSGSLSEMATAYGTQAKFYNAPALTMSATSIPNVGGAIEAVGAAFGLTNPGQRTPVMGADSGVILIELKSRTEAAEIADYTTYMTQIKQRKQANDRLNLRQSIREAADIVDERYKFF